MEKLPCSFLQCKQPVTEYSVLYYSRFGTNITESIPGRLHWQRNFKDLCLRASKITCSRQPSCLASDSSMMLCRFIIARMFPPVTSSFPHTKYSALKA